MPSSISILAKTPCPGFYDGILVNGRYRITNAASRCGKLPVGQNVTGWVPASYCGVDTSTGGGGGGTKATMEVK